MHEFAQQPRNSPNHRVKPAQRLDLKAVYAILVKAYFRNHSVTKVHQQEFKENPHE